MFFKDLGLSKALSFFSLDLEPPVISLLSRLLLPHE